MQKSMHKTELEICLYSPEACVAASEGGADRVELCASPAEGGVTPSYGAVKLARTLFLGELYVMIRPRGGDFCYSDIAFRTMAEDIQMAREAGADGVVFGILCSDGSVDRERTAALTRLAAPLKVTFHRAFDLTSDPFEALEAVIDCGCHRILTSGQKPTAVEGASLIKQLVSQAAGRIALMAGGGVRPENAPLLRATGVQALHSSAGQMEESLMQFRRKEIALHLGSPLPEYANWGCNRDIVGRLKALTAQ